jgi:hypothetical protein
MPFDHVVGELAQFFQLAGSGKVFEMAKAQKAGRRARHHGCGFHGFAAHAIGRARQRQRPRGGNAQRVHGLAHQKFTDA